MKKQDKKVLNTVLVGALAAMVYVVTLFRFPLLGSKVHFANAVCLLAGLLMGRVPGGLAAGLGSALYDLTMYNEGIVNLLITFVSKFAMAWVAAVLFRAFMKKYRDSSAKETILPLVISCVIGALTYVALYMLKTWIFKMYVEPVPADTIPTVMIAKLGPSLINAAFAIVVAPIFYHAVLPALKSTGIYRQLEGV